jgi:tRNA-Thr(GGU) m(6)t(6)A37 methyltransferase TsaA
MVIMSGFEVNYIGKALTPFKEKFGTPRQPLISSSQSRIEIFTKYQPELSLRSLEGFDYIWVIWHFSKNKDSFKSMVTPPRAGGKKLGVFGTRSPHHPNNIGLSVVKLISIDPPFLTIEGADFVDGTPIIDIKPYLSATEAHPTAKLGWEAVVNTIEVLWNDVALNQVSEYGISPQLKDEISNCLTQDPRDLSDKKSTTPTHHGFVYSGFNIKFTASGSQIEVTEISPR